MRLLVYHYHHYSKYYSNNNRFRLTHTHTQRPLYILNAYSRIEKKQQLFFRSMNAMMKLEIK